MLTKFYTLCQEKQAKFASKVAITNAKHILPKSFLLPKETGSHHVPMAAAILPHGY
jgi:hypothetical protein